MVGFHERGAGDPLVLLNGMASSSHSWSPSWVALLEHSCRLLLIDNRGTGSSTHSGEPFSMSDLAADVVEALDRCGLESAHVLGQSMGGTIAATVAIEHPGRVHRLVLASSGPGGTQAVPPRPDVMAKLMAMSQGRLEPEEMVSAVTGRGFAERHPEVIAAVGRQHRAEQVDRSVIGLQVQASLGFDPARLGDVRAPTLVVHGDDDPVVPLENGRLLAAAIPGARMEVLPGVGHMLGHEAPEEFAQLVEEFLSAAQS
jgi:3-oxoadipate enol-lactonase